MANDSGGGTDLAARLRQIAAPLVVKPGRTVSLSRDFDPAHKAGFADQMDAAEITQHAVQSLAKLQDRLAAQRTHAVLVVLQGMDASGKDGLIKHVMSGLNPQGVEVHAFKVPTDEELLHDYLWRHQKALPERGQIGIFNRSHYEEVLTVRVHPSLLAREQLPAGSRTGLWRQRFQEINAWERHLVDNGTRLVKLFLNLSREEQRRRLLARIDDPDKNWKFSSADLKERESWREYQRAYAALLSNTSTQWAPWHVIPADHKWFARLAAAGVLVDALKAIDPQYPKVDDAQRQALRDGEAELLRQAPAARRPRTPAG